MKKRDMDWWCDRAWIKFGLLITAAMTIAILVFWDDWSTELKVTAAMAALIPVHVVEEWVFPGGFNYQYNVALYKSDVPDRYPMSRISDMFTNLVTTVFYVVLTAYSAYTGSVHTGILLGTLVFCCLEFFAHTMMGVRMYYMFRDRGKTTIYGPGSITAYLGFTVFAVILIRCLDGVSIGTEDILVGVGLLAFIAVVCILIPENATKSKENERYAFRGNGYFDRFLR
ncbi:MAG: HXXEE domain-containing protein [Thermoplasmata archaeon]|nr:HXXEE domain-containing protein [Thermoplasmata archaeon]